MNKLCRAARIKVFLIWTVIVVGIYSLCGEWIRNIWENRATKHHEAIHLVAVSCGRPNYQGVRDIQKPMDLTVTMVKSASLFAKSQLHVHIFTEEDMVGLFEAEFESWPPKILSRVQFNIYKINYDEHIPKSLASVWKRWYKPCGSYRLLVPMILENVTDAAIYSDSDVVFVKPIDELWAHLKEMQPRHVVAVSPTAGHPLGGSKYNENFISHPSGLFQINTGVMVMNFKRMLNADWLLHYDEKSKSANEIERLKYGPELLLSYYKKYEESAEHDQKLLNIMFHFNPDLIKQLPCSWNFKNNFCQDDNNVCSVAEVGGGAGAVHGITSVFFGNGNPVFRALYETFLKYDFEEDMDASLLQPFLRQLKTSGSATFCGRKAHVITKPLASSIRSVLSARP